MPIPGAIRALRVHCVAQGIAGSPHYTSLPIMPTQTSAALFRARFFDGSRPSRLPRRTELPGVRMVVVMMAMMMVSLRKTRRGEQHHDGKEKGLFHSPIISPNQRTAI